ncbi:MFS transporter [[Eubacterium] hominis]|uniref:MFS transporter n=1 Tax=[Eubacterium] hominis TaxID=2764325 RepID=UPI003A4DFFE4
MKLSKKEYLLLVASAIFACAITIANVFSNVYLFSYCNSLQIMALYSACKCLFMFFAFFLFSKIRFNALRSMKVGLCFLIVTFCIILLLHDTFVHIAMLYLVGCLWGFGEGGFYLSMNTMNQLVTKKETRMKYVGFNGAINAFVAVLSPLLASLCVIVMKDDLKGYLLSFQFVVVLFLLLLYVLRYLNIEDLNPEKQSYLKIYRESKKETSWRFISMINFLQGFRESLSLCVTGLLVFQMMSDHSTWYALVLAGFSVVAILSNMVLSKWMNTEKRRKLFFIGNLGMLFSGMILVLSSSFENAILHGITHNLFVPFVSMPIMFDTMNVLQDSIAKHQFEVRMVLREFYLEAGRILGLIVYATCNLFGKQDDLLSFMIIYGSSIVLLWYVKHKQGIMNQYQ